MSTEAEAAELTLRNLRVGYVLRVTGLTILLVFALVEFLRFLAHIRTVTTIVLAAVLFAYIIAPMIRRLRQRVPMWAAILIVYGMVGAIIAVALGIVIPLISDNLRQFIHDAPALLSALQNALTNPRNPLFAHLPGPLKTYLAKIPSELTGYFNKHGSDVASSALTIFVSTASILALFVIVPVCAAYLLMDSERLHALTLAAFPRSVRPTVVRLMNAFDDVLGGFIRGQLLVAATVGVLVSILLLTLHVKYAILIGIVAGVVEIMPYVGAFVGAIPAVIIALLTNGWQNALLVVFGFVVINQLEGHIISPLIVGESVGLTPLFVLLALLTGGELLGLPGLLIAVPVAGLIRALLITFVPIDREALPAEAPARKKRVLADRLKRKRAAKT